MIIVSNLLKNMNFINKYNYGENVIFKTLKIGYNLCYKILYYPFYGIYNIINICKLILYISLFFLYKRFTGNYNDYILKQIMDKINKCGYIVIKFTQWTTSRLLLMKNTEDNIRVIKKMEDIYENCHTHTLNETNKLYNLDYNRDISEDYKILEIIGSGSIGQVYKAIDKKTDKFVAIKVKHYDIEYKYKLSYLVIRYIIFIFKIFPYLNYKYFPIDLSEFLNQVNNQLNFENESKNGHRLYEEFYNNDMVIIPKILKSSKNIIIMDYIDCDDFDTLNISNIRKRHISLYFTMILYQMTFVNKFTHGDIHKGNWKIKYYKDNSFQIVFFDFGYMWLIDDVENAKYFIECIRYNISENISKILIDNSIRTTDEANINMDDVNSMVSYLIKGGDTTNTIKIDEFMQMAGDISLKYKIIYNTTLINILVMLVQMDKLCIDNKIRQEKPMINTNALEFQRELNNDYIVLCKLYNYHNELEEYYIGLNNKFNTGRSVFDSVDYLDDLILDD